MGILMAGLSPHPPLIIPEIGGERRREVSATIESLKELGSEITDCEPDLLITISPHGPVFRDAISILDQEKIQGDFGDFACPEVSMEVENDLHFIDKLKQTAENNGIEVITLTPDQMVDFQIRPRLDHGVMVPLHFILEAGLEAPVIPITMGLLSYEKLYKFGGIIRKTLDEIGLNAVILASGDLSHRLKPGAPAGFNPRGKKFDQRLVELLNSEDYQGVLQLDTQLIEKAGECGLRPLIIMLGAIQDLNFRSEVKSYEGPFGVGYAVVGFYPEVE